MKFGMFDPLSKFHKTVQEVVIASKLLVFNAALLLVGERKLASLTENREPR